MKQGLMRIAWEPIDSALEEKIPSIPGTANFGGSFGTTHLWERRVKPKVLREFHLIGTQSKKRILNFYPWWIHCVLVRMS